MKAITGEQNATAAALTRKLKEQGFFNDLPVAAQSSITEQVLNTLPSLRNKLGGHGQGTEVVIVPKVYAQLACELAAAFHNFLIAKNLERSAAVPAERDDDIPW